MRLFRLLLSTLVLATSAFAAPAWAQTVGTLVVGTPAWSNRPKTTRPITQINRADCLATNASIKFSTAWTGLSNGQGVFEAWAGQDCQTSTKRTGTPPTCVKVADGDVGGESITVRVQDLVKDYDASLNEVAGTAASCDEVNDDGENSRTLYFVVYDSNKPEGSLVQTTPTWPFTFDTVGPAPPTGVTVSGGENSVTVKLTAPENEPKLSHYRFYCTPNESGSADVCSAAALVPNSAPNEENFCGSIDAQAVDSGSSDTKLANGISYAVALASQDSYENVGVLSALSCATPKEVTGFYEAYRAAGGQAGGGYCSYAPARRGSGALALATLLGAAALLRRRK